MRAMEAKTKRCTGCKANLPIDAFQPNKARLEKATECRACDHKRKRAYRLRYPDQVRNTFKASSDRAVAKALACPPLVKRCTSCKATMPIEAFNPSAANTTWAARCKTCSLAHSRACNARNHDRILARRREKAALHRAAVGPKRNGPHPADPSAPKHCSVCDCEKPADDFYRSANRRTSYCKACIRKAATAWRTANPERQKASVKKWQVKQRYGLTMEQYEAMKSSQGGVCALCKQTPKPDRLGRGLVIDHDHATGLARALLCFPCNTGLGHFKDDPTRLRAAVEYIERHQRCRT